MAEECDYQGTKIYVEGDTTVMTMIGSVANVVAGDQIHGNHLAASETTETSGETQHTIRVHKESAILAEGEQVHQHFVKSNVNVVAGDQIQRNQYVTNIFQETRPFDKGAPIFQPNDDGWWDEAPKKCKWKHVTRFLEKLKAYSLKNIQGKAMDDYKDLSRPQAEFCPQMKTGFNLYRGDYVPQQGFSAHSRTKSGESLNFSECVEATQTNQAGKPFTIIGPPGSGKTVLMKRLAKKLILEKLSDTEIEMWRQMFGCFRENNSETADVIFHMNIRDIPNFDNATLAQVLFSPSVTGLTKKEAQHGLKAIIENKIKIIILFDGLDQASWEPNSEIKVGPWTKTNTATLFGNILSGNLLTDVPITISSREHAVACLPKDMRPEFITALTGFSEKDAKTMYCQIMGKGADTDWDEMRKSNPGMMYMCLTPLFLIFYMITRKNDPDDPPDCATGVMIRIIQILLESDHMRNVAKVINKLKKMAFQGTKEQRVVFTNEDLDDFEIKYKDVSDVIIKVAGLNILAQNILDGTYRFFFSHQTLQEILTALHVVEMDLSDFMELASMELPNPHWSVVWSFVCGILKNERVKARINPKILKTDDLDAKCAYLMENLETHLKSNPPSAQKLDLFVALKEANALDILRNYADHLDFSNSPLTPSMMNVLCSVMKHLNSVPFLSLATSGIDDEMLEVIGNSTENLGIKISNFDVRGNVGWTDAGLWRKIFRNLTISSCWMEIPHNEQGEASVDMVVKIVEAANENVRNLDLGELGKMHFEIGQLQHLVTYNISTKLSQLWMKPDAQTFDESIWKQTLQQTSFIVERCFVEPPKLSEDRVDVDIWIKAAKSAYVENVKEICLISTDEIVLNINEIRSLNDAELRGQISQLHIEYDLETFDFNAWQETFQRLSITIDHCILLPKEEVDNVLVEAAKSADVDNVKSISLKSINSQVKASIGDITSLNKPKFRGELRYLKTFGNKRLSSQEWRQFGIMTRKFNASRSLHTDYPLVPDLLSFAEGHGNLQCQRIMFWNFRGIYLDLPDSDLKNGNIKLLKVHFSRYRLLDIPQDVGRVISECGFEDVVFGDSNFDNLDVASFASGLNNFKIKRLAAAFLSDETVLSSLFSSHPAITYANDTTLLEIVRRCNVKHLYIYEELKKESLKHLTQLTQVTILSWEEWRETFLLLS